MLRAADALEKGKSAQASPDVTESSRMLGGLAQQLEAAHRGLVQPQLDRLLAAEKQAADTQKAIQSVNDDRQKAEAEKRVSDLRDTMESFKDTQGRMAQATAELQEALRQGGVWRVRGERRQPLQGQYLPPVSYERGVRDAVGALQAKIQEVILQDALLEKDEGVPSQYKAWVEEYYRILSEDIR